MVQDIVVGKGFSDRTPFAKEWRPTIDNKDLIKLKSFYIVKKKEGGRREKKEKNKQQLNEEEPLKIEEDAR